MRTWGTARTSPRDWGVVSALRWRVVIMRTSFTGRQGLAWVPRVALLIVLLPAVSAGQELVKSFDQLGTRLRVGDTIWVTDTQGRAIRGKIHQLTPSGLTLDDGSGVTFQGAAVRVIEQHRPKPLKKGTLWGLAAGAGLGITWLAIAAQDPGDGGAGVAAAMLGGCLGIGAGLGSAIGAAVPAKRVVVYRASGTAAAARLSIAPVIARRAKGVAFTFTF